MPFPQPTAIDLFCGSGGVTQGLKDSGFKVVAALDFNQPACATYRENHPEVMLYERDITKMNPEEIRKLKKNDIGLVAICAPCQPFSRQNRNRSIRDDRSRLVLSALPFVEILNPKVVFLENVPGLGKKSVFKRFTKALRNFGYDVSNPMCLDAGSLGVAQRRNRMIMIATKGLNIDVAINIASKEKVTVRQAIGDLPVPSIGFSCQLPDPMHFARKHSAINIDRLKQIPHDGGGRKSLPARLQLACHKSNRPNSFSDTYSRMKWDDVAPTLTTGCTDITRGRYAHPVQNRAITLREAARLQSFPDDYKFIGVPKQIAMQIGNAVPPQMMCTIGESIMAAFACEY